MKCHIRSAWLRQSGMLFASAALAFGGLIWSVPGLSAPAITTIATKLPASKSSGIADAINKLRKSNQRWIEVNLTTQRLITWEGKTPVRAVVVSTGKPATPTLTGVFAIAAKYRTTRMQGDDYDVPDVPYTMYYSGGYAIHGAYWHRNFGTPVSHGCVNVAVDHAEQLFKWASVGTPIVVHQ